VRRGKLKGFIENGELAWYYAGTKIAINHNRTVIGEDDDGKLLHVKKRQAWSLGPRPYEIAACGTFQLSTPDRPELRKVFGRTVPTYKNGKDLRKKIAYYLEHDDERRELARSAQDKVKHCRFEDRAKEILIPTITEVI
jgi:spore maturation protein CgeB